MPKQINVVELQGHLGADPDYRFTQNGKSLCKFRLATTDRKKNRDTGEWENGETHWHNVTCFGDTAEWVGNNLKKGMCANIHGKITYRKYEEKYYTDIIAFNVKLVEHEGKAKTSVSDDQEIPF